MIVMLSPPIPCVARGSSLMISFSICSPISVGVIESIRARTYSTAFSFVRQSQMPSQPRMRNSSSSASSTLCACCMIRGRKGVRIARYFRKKRVQNTRHLTHWTISGSAVIIWSGGAMLGTCLYFRSPIDLDRFKFPFTRPKWLTKPPALRIRVSSRS